MTFLEIITRMQNKLKDTGDITWTLALKKQNINEAYKVLYTEMIEAGAYNIKSASISVVAGTQEYSLPSDFGVVYGNPYRSSDYLELYPIDYKYHDYDLDTTAAQSTPMSFYIYNAYGKITTAAYAKIGLRPIPDSAFTLTVNYIPNLAELSADTDVPMIDNTWHDLITLLAMVICLEDILGGEDDVRYKNYMVRYQEGLAKFRKYLKSRHRGIPQEFMDSYNFDGLLE